MLLTRIILKKSAMESVADQYIITDSIEGYGMQGSVFQAEHKLSKKLYVAKITKLCDKKQQARFANEIKLLKLLGDCKNVIRLVDSFVAGADGVLILERMPYDLMALIENDMLNKKQRVKIFTQVCKAIRDMHRKGIAHLDIKPENILVSIDFSSIKICDFGCSRLLPPSGLVKSESGTIMYSSPEYARGEICDGKKADIWSLGILYHILLTDYFPYDFEDINLQVATGTLVLLQSSLSDNQAQLIKKLLRECPKERIDSEVVYSILRAEQHAPEIFVKVYHKLKKN